MNRTPLYPLRFEPLYEHRLWGGRRLGDVLSTPLPADGHIGEAWVLSDRDEHLSRVASGPLRGATLTELMHNYQELLLGNSATQHGRFPLLLKFLDANQALSVQVHPSDSQTDVLPPGESGKTEAWVVLQTGPNGRIYAGVRPGTTSDELRGALASGTVSELLTSFRPLPGDGVLVQAGVVHSLDDVVVFEVQQNSDVTFRLYDWDHVDDTTGKHRDLQVDQAMACIDFAQGALGPVVPVTEAADPVLRERLIDCEHFGVWRCAGASPFTVGAAGSPRVLVGIAGEGRLEYEGTGYPLGCGDVLLLPAAVGVCVCRPSGALTLLELSLPDDGRR